MAISFKLATSEFFNSVGQAYFKFKNCEASNVWFENLEKKNNTSNTLRSSLLHPVKGVSLTSTSSNIQISSQGHNEINIENSVEQMQTLSSNASQLVPSIEIIDDEYIKYSLFKRMFSNLNSLLHILNNQHLSSHSQMVKSTISEIKILESNIDLNNEKSISNARKLISFIIAEYQTKFSYYYLRQNKCKINLLLKNSFTSIITILKKFSIKLQRYRPQNYRDYLIRRSNQSLTTSSTIVQKI
ncbi:unnamed protein product [Rotaria sp. Silwood2]|nr:unnamed protein product [Rotaria sp. Silwood2]